MLELEITSYKIQSILSTGDVGEFLPNGTLRIIDQKKLIFKLSRGEYVAPDKVEQIYQASPYIDQVSASSDNTLFSSRVSPVSTSPVC